MQRLHEPIAIVFLLGLIVFAFFVSLSRIFHVDGVSSSYAAEESMADVSSVSSASSSSAQRLSRAVRIPILVYHYVEIVQNPRDRLRQAMNIKPDTFELQLQLLQKNGYQTYFVRDIPAMIDGRQDLPQKGIMLTFDDGYADFYQYVLPLLQKYNMKATLYIVDNFIGKDGYLTADQLKEIVLSGLVEIGGHTEDHLRLTTLSEADARKQIAEGRDRLQKDYGVSVTTFAYPYGSYNDMLQRLAKEAGYIAAVSEDKGIVQTEKTLFSLPRLRAGAFLGRNALYNIR